MAGRTGHRLQRSNVSSPSPVASHLQPPVLGVCPWLAHPSSLTVVQLSGWPQGAHPEIGRLVWCKDKGICDLLGLPRPKSHPHPLSSLGRRLGWLGGIFPLSQGSADHPPFRPPGPSCAWFTDSGLPAQAQEVVVVLRGWGLRAGPASVPGVARAGGRAPS